MLLTQLEKEHKQEVVSGLVGLDNQVVEEDLLLVQELLQQLESKFKKPEEEV